MRIIQLISLIACTATIGCAGSSASLTNIDLNVLSSIEVDDRTEEVRFSMYHPSPSGWEVCFTTTTTGENSEAVEVTERCYNADSDVGDAVIHADLRVGAEVSGLHFTGGADVGNSEEDQACYSYGGGEETCIPFADIPELVESALP